MCWWLDRQSLWTEALACLRLYVPLCLSVCVLICCFKSLGRDFSCPRLTSTYCLLLNGFNIMHDTCTVLTDIGGSKQVWDTAAGQTKRTCAVMRWWSTQVEVRQILGMNQSCSQQDAELRCHVLKSVEWYRGRKLIRKLSKVTSMCLHRSTSDELHVVVVVCVLYCGTQVL